MTNEELLAGAALKSWKLVLGRFDKDLANLSDADFQKRVAPGRNRLYYLYGHLTAVHDRLLPMLGIGERLHPELDEAFISSPDGATSDSVSVADLRAAWTDVNARLTAAFESYSPQDWLRKHTAVSDEDFVADPTRNRLAVVLSRTNHLSFHTGQFVLAK
ncbi:MAG TPA: DinB family protein [Acidobacteriaceae bacterium]|nr:DinB family protein [Acidobacteriaceae bacterium]